MLRLLSYLLLINSLLIAETPKKVKEAPPPDESAIGVGHLPIDLFWVYGGIDAGYNTLSTSVAGEEAKAGLVINAKVITKLFSAGLFDVDISLGGLFSSLSGATKSGSVSSFFAGVDSTLR